MIFLSQIQKASAVCFPPSSTLHGIEMALVPSFTGNKSGLIYVALCVAKPAQFAPCPHH